MNADSIGGMMKQPFLTPGVAPLLNWQGLHILPGLNAVTGDEGSGKTRLLRELCDNTPDALWLNPALPEHGDDTPEHVWAQLQTRCPQWNTALQEALTQALSLQPHLGKQLFMLSTGSRRKVGLVGLLASGVTVTCLDQPYVSLDAASIQVVRDFLNDMASHSSRAWVVADYTADPELTWSSQIDLD